MVVTLGAARRHAEKDTADGAGDVVQMILPELLLGVRIGFPGRKAQEAEGDQPIGGGGGLLAAVFVTCDLFLHKQVIGFIAVKCANDVVTIAPGGGALAIDGKAIGLRIAD